MKISFKKIISPSNFFLLTTLVSGVLVIGLVSYAACLPVLILRKAMSTLHKSGNEAGAAAVQMASTSMNRSQPSSEQSSSNQKIAS